MQLYLKINRPEGKKFLIMQHGKPAKDHGPYWLYPDKPTQVPDADAKHLLAQDPHLVSQEKPDFKKPFPTTADEIKEKYHEVEQQLNDALQEREGFVNTVKQQEEIIANLQNEIVDLKERLSKYVGQSEVKEGSATVKKSK